MRPLIALLVLVAACATARTPHTHRHTFDDAERWARVFDDPERDAWQKPHQVIQALGLAPDAHVADLGAGTGYFAVRLASTLPKGRIYAVDIAPDMVRYLEARAKREELRNIVAIQGEPDDPKLPRQVDLILLVDVYHHVDNRVDYFRRLGGVLRAHGRIAIVDFRLDAPAGPPRAARIAPDTVKAEMKAAGYALAAEHGFLPYQYFLVFEPAS